MPGCGTGPRPGGWETLVYGINPRSRRKRIEWFWKIWKGTLEWSFSFPCFHDKWSRFNAWNIWLQREIKTGACFHRLPSEHMMSKVRERRKWWICVRHVCLSWGGRINITKEPVVRCIQTLNFSVRRKRFCVCVSFPSYSEGPSIMHLLLQKLYLRLNLFYTNQCTSSIQRFISP